MGKIQEFKLEKEEMETGINRAKSMVRVYQAGEWNADEIESHFKEWKKIAARIKKGAPMVDKLNTVRPASVDYKNQLNNLYDYLMTLLGFYDLFFKCMFKHEPQLYYDAQAEILLELK